MARTVFLILITILNLTICVLSTTEIKIYEITQNSSLSYPGKQLIGHTFEELTTKRQTIHCAYECLKTPKCKSFNYEQTRQVCQLNDATHVEHNDSLIEETDGHSSVYHLRDAFYVQKEALGPCAQNPCQHGGRCLDSMNWKMERTYYCVCTDGWEGANCEYEKNRIDWDEWGDWGPCSVSCETGWTTRHRACLDTVTDQRLSSSKCFGTDVEYKSCTLLQCPRWNTWGEWGTCSTEQTCGRGSKRRERTCANGGVPGVDRFCLGFTNDTAPCMGIDCRGLVYINNGAKFGEGRIEIRDDIADIPIPICATPGWDKDAANIVCRQFGFQGAYAATNDTSLYGPPAMTGASQVMSVNCTGTEKTIQKCVRTAVDNCTAFAGAQCSVRGGWSLWESWGECSVTCENGTRRRSRDCVHPPPNFNGTTCPTEGVQFKHCQLPMCPNVYGTWGEWEPWSGCDVTCGEGLRERDRICSDDIPCPGRNVTYDICITPACTSEVDGVWTSWSTWSDCSVTCANGTRYRTRECTGPFYGGAECPGPDEEVEDCFPRMCEVDGVWDPWTPWSECSHTCGYGNRNRSRTCYGPFYGGLECPGPPDEIETCNAFSCPVDGAWHLWTEWGECSVTCGGGLRNRTRDCNDPIHGGANCVGPTEQAEDCNDFNCPIDGVFTEWAAWGECTVTCANGTQYRDRTCIGPFYGGANCTGPYDDEQICVTESCPVDGVWDNWQGWQSCNVTCGGGTRIRDRKCFGPFFGGSECDGPPIDAEACNTHNCPIDGIWVTWSSWFNCDVTCDGGRQNRSRSCSGPFYDGADCVGPTEDWQDCNTQPCPVDGVWDGWQNWGNCSASCGGGMAIRQRTCILPLYGGHYCTGDDEESISCNTHFCPVDGVWIPWSNWTECSLTCGNGTQDRHRTCDGPYYNGTDCQGPWNETRLCNTFHCPVDGLWLAWTEWGECSLTCGRGTTIRTRVCEGPFHGGDECHGPYSESTLCNPNNCPVNGVWMDWAEWAECSTTCENGTRLRNRTCDGPYFGGANCTGSDEHVEDCFLRMCPIDGVWEEWTVWDECPVTCGGSIHNRTRSCTGPFHDGANCTGPGSDTRDCGTIPCPVDGDWSLWSMWTGCNVTCGGGQTSRYRVCSESKHGGSNCTGPSGEILSCNEHECPIDGIWEAWVEWTECTHTCGTGERQRFRNCTGPFYGGTNCSGDWDQLELCNTFECPEVFGEWGSWKVWGACSASCRGGKQLRVRDCHYVSGGGIVCIGPSQEMRNCNEHKCPVDGVWEPWVEWSACNVSCGGGTRTRSRNCTGPFYGGAECPGDSDSWEDCNTHECPVDGVWEPWSQWDICSVTCGGGNQSRYRDCIGPFYGGQNCSGPPDETRDCNTFECPIDGVLSEWSEFYTCAVTCGGGIQWRNRTCFGPYYGGQNCTEPLENSRECNMHNCPIDGVWIPWSPWGECDVTCAGGIQFRNRTCDGPYYNGSECPGPDLQNRTCNDFYCPVDGVWEPWTDWDPCSVSCGGSVHSRYRNCTGPFYGGANCTGPPLETRDCNTHHCPVDGVFTLWSEWEECDVTCGGGIQWRNRSCDGPFYGGAECDGAYNDSQSCNTQECPIDGVWIEWGAWEQCTVTCGGGILLRERECEGPYYGGADCVGPLNDTEICGTALCPIPGLWFEWTQWSLCTTTCGGGLRQRNRTCDWESFGNLTAPCEGPEEEIEDCHMFACEPLAIHCADWASRGLNQSCYANVDPDGDEPVFENVTVECDFDTEPGKAITILHHNSENRTHIKGFEGAGEYQVTFIYDVGWAEAITIIDSSAECAQFMRWECLAAIIHNPFNPEWLTTFWTNRTEQVTNYFGGATPGSGNCACGETGTCFNTSLPCNCDENDLHWRSDEGWVTNKGELPIHSFYAGDTGGMNEDGYKTVSPVNCAGFA